MKELTQNAGHLLYRLKTYFLHQSRLAVFFRRRFWKAPAEGTVQVIFREAQDIRSYFHWNELDDPVAREKLKTFTERYAHEPNVVYEVKGELIIEPDFGLAIAKGRRLIRESGTLSHTFLTPHFLNYLRHYYFRKTYTCYDTFILCDGFAGINLCHFIYDTINPILFQLERGMISESDPILIGEKVFKRPYFAYVMEHTRLGKLNWIVQKENEWIKVNRFRKAFVSMEIFKSTYPLFAGLRKPHRRIFLNRKTQFQRNLRNIDSLLVILRRYGFEMVFAEDLSYPEQVALFREVKYFIGIHGAGLTNLLHSEIQSLRVLELFSQSLVHASFYRFLKILGVNYYNALAGTSFDLNWKFEVEERAFEEHVQKLIEA